MAEHMGSPEMALRLKVFSAGEFVQRPDGSYEYSGGAVRTETVPPSARYADLCYAVSEALGTAVGLKYRCPGEDLDPGALITLADDDDVEELREEFTAAADRHGSGGTGGGDPSSDGPAVDVFAFPAHEEPLTPREILCAQQSTARGRGSEGGPGLRRGSDASAAAAYAPSSLYDPTLYDPTLALEQQALLHALAADAAVFGGAAGSGGSGAVVGSASASTSEFDADVLVAIAAGSGGIAAASGALWQTAACAGGACDDAYLLSECLASDSTPYGCVDEDDEDGCGSPMYEAADEAEAEMAAYWLREAAAEAAARRASAAAAAAAVLSEAPGRQPLARLLLPADPFEQEASPSSAALIGGDDLAAAADAGPASSTAPAPETGGTDAEAVRLAAPFGATPLGDAVLPSHISAFGDADGSDGGGDPLLQGYAATPTASAPRGALSYSLDDDEAGAAALAVAAAATASRGPRPRRRSRSLSPDDGAPDRQGSGDSVTSLPRVQPVHRLSRADIRVTSKIGEGAFGEVSLAQAPLYGTVAVKWLKSELFSKHSTSFLREAALLSDLHHPNVLRFYGVVVDAATGPHRPSSSSATTAAPSPSPSPRAAAAAAGGGGGSGAAAPPAAAFGGSERAPSPALSSSAPPTPAAARVVGIVTEFVPGGPLSRFLRASRAPLPLRLRCELALQAANGLAYLHELSTVHFDLKPDNLLLDGPPALVAAAARAGDASLPSTTTGPASPAGDAAGAPAAALARAVAAGWAPTVKVADFGLAKHKLGGYVSSCRDLRGTLPYMAPELVADPEHVSEKADCWSLGVVMWEMLTREAPYKDLTAPAVLRGLMTGALTLDVPEWAEPEWRGLLEACLEPNPDNRPSMRELARQIEAIRDHAAAEADAADAAVAVAAAAAAAVAAAGV